MKHMLMQSSPALYISLSARLNAAILRSLSEFSLYLPICSDMVSSVSLSLKHMEYLRHMLSNSVKNSCAFLEYSEKSPPSPFIFICGYCDRMAFTRTVFSAALDTAFQSVDIPVNILPISPLIFGCVLFMSALSLWAFIISE